MKVVIVPNSSGNPPGKLADAELHFTDGPLEGVKSTGWAIWEGRGGGKKNVTFPARQYAVNGERRSYALIRPITEGDSASQEKVRQVILDAYNAWEEDAAHHGGVSTVNT